MRCINFRHVGLTATLLSAAAIGLTPVTASAGGGPNPTSAVVTERVFNDCGSSTLTTVNDYPTLISILDEENCPGPFANRHNWRFSEDGVSAVDFDNGSVFRFSAEMTISGTGGGEAGIGISPWWSQEVDGTFNVRASDGEVACFGGRLPFYSFTASDAVVYVMGTPITLGIEYHPNALSEADPATIEYTVAYDGGSFSSGPIPFDEGNPAEGMGSWGMLDQARVGGNMQIFTESGSPDSDLQVDWGSIEFENLSPTPIEDKSWGAIKSIYSR